MCTGTMSVVYVYRSEAETRIFLQKKAQSNILGFYNIISKQLLECFLLNFFEFLHLR